ncbi:MAG: carbohydrate-binding domain-containing protein [Ruminococcus sp.]|nr:carbohydrate-binding domain-containing protein [Ruminococcus sp.]
MLRKRNLFSLFLILMLLLTGCGNENSSAPEEETSETSSGKESSENTIASASEMFTDRDFEIGYDEETSALITLEGDSASCESDAVEISGSTVTIKDEGTYILSGTLDDGMIVVNAQKTDKPQLVFDNVSINSSTSAPLYILQADKVFITLAEGSENTLSNGGTFTAIDENNIDAAIFSKEDLTLNGSGTLTVASPSGHGIVSKDDLVFTSGAYNITASSHAVSGKDSVRIANASFTTASGKDGFHAENTDDTSLGFLYMESGKFDITADGDGISASSYLQIEDGEFNLFICGGSANAEGTQTSDWMMGGPMGMSSHSDPGAPIDTDSTTEEETASSKGLKASGALTINGGNFTIDSSDDAIHSNSSLLVNGGTFEIATGDDGFHADDNLTIASGKINISQSYEGLEGLNIDITGGDITLTASDDGLNSAGGNDESGYGGPRENDMFAVDENSYIHISGGNLYVNADGDGIDSNGSLNVSGGYTIVEGPTNGGNGALDYASDAAISGGTFIASGSSEMAMNFGSSSTQGVMLVSTGTQAGGSLVEIYNSDVESLLSWESTKEFSCIVLSCPELLEGETYSLTAGTASGDITMESIVMGSGQSAMPGGNMGGGMPGDMGGMPGRGF